MKAFFTCDMDTQKNVLYSFCGYSVDVAERSAWKADNIIPLVLKAIETLVGHVRPLFTHL